MDLRIRQAVSSDGPTLMHMEHGCRAAATFLPTELRDPGLIRPRDWRAWLRCDPPFDRHPTKRLAYLAYEHTDTLGFIAVMHESIFGGYGADVAGLFVVPQYRRAGTGTKLLVRAARWLQEDGIERMTADCFAHDASREFFEHNGGVVIASISDDSDPAARITYGFANLKELAARPL
jgi:GNAT superfamily N-acetyltransferase